MAALPENGTQDTSDAAAGSTADKKKKKKRCAGTLLLLPLTTASCWHCAQALPVLL
jgi:hypothetical protein